MGETLVYAGQSYPLSWEYNANGHPTQLTYPDSKVVTMSPNALGQSMQIKQTDRSESFANSISYYPNGAVASFSYGNGITRTVSQNTRGLPWVATDGTVLNDTYTYDANANVAGIADGTSSGMSRTMTYDGLDRLTTTIAPGMWNNATYTYDALDNIRTSVIGTASNTHNYDATKNRLDNISTSISGGAATATNYAYDVQGNITTKGGQGFSFDQGNRMLSATGKGNYVYDGLGHRVLSTNPVDGTQTVNVYSPAGMLLYTHQTGGPNPPKKTRYVYLNRHLIAEVAQ